MLRWRGPDDVPILGQQRQPDFSSFVEFFKHFDRTVEAMNDLNMVAHLMIYVEQEGQTGQN